MLDLICFFAGKFNKYKSFISNKFWRYDVEDSAFALMKNNTGIIASIHSTATQWKHKFNIEITLEKALDTFRNFVWFKILWSREVDYFE